MASTQQQEDLELQTAWRRLAVRRGLLKTKPEAPRGSGVSLAYLEALAQTLQQLESEYEVPCRTADVMHQVILPALMKQAGRGRLLELVPARFTGPPQWYICHAWDAGFRSMVQTVQQEVAPDPGPAEPPLPPGFKEETMLWIDLFAVSCYPVHSTKVLDDNRLRSLAAESEAMVREEMDACAEGVVLVVDENFSCLSRAWCMFEVFCTAYAYGSMGMRLALPGGIRLSKIFDLKDACTEVEFSRLCCHKAHEKRFLLSLVKHRCGLKRTNAITCEALQEALYYKLRWRGKVWETLTLAALWLRDGDLTKLQLLLNRMQELKDDDETLEEMRALFQSFDKDRSGEIDEDEFFEMLTVAGWNVEDAHTAFLEVNTDGQGGVSLDEFEQWWLKRNQDDHKSKQGPENDLTVVALCNNVDRLAAYAERMQLPEHAQYFRSSLIRLQAEFRAEDHGLHVPQPQLRGDVDYTLDQVAERLLTKDHNAACFLMYDLLVKNQEMLTHDPLTLQPPNSLATPEQQAKLLADYMEMMLKMVSYQLPNCQCQYDFLKESIAELLTDLAKGPESKVKKGQAGEERSFMANRLALRENLRVRYGTEQRITPRQIKELQKAISQFVANARGQPRGFGMAQSSPTKMVLHQERTERASKLRQPMSMGDMEMPSLADLRAKLRETLSRDRSLELGLPMFKQERRRTSSVQAGGAWLKQAGQGGGLVSATSAPLLAVPKLDLSALTRGSTALPSTPRSLTQTPRGACAASANSTPRGADEVLAVSTPRSSSHMVSPRGGCGLRWSTAMDDVVDRDLRRGSDDGDIMLKRYTPSVSGFFAATEHSATLKALSSELASIRSRTPQQARPGTSAGQARPGTSTGQSSAPAAPSTPIPDPRFGLPALAADANADAGSWTPRCPSRLLNLKLLKRRESQSSLAAVQLPAAGHEAGPPPSRASMRSRLLSSMGTRS